MSPKTSKSMKNRKKFANPEQTTLSGCYAQHYCLILYLQSIQELIFDLFYLEVWFDIHFLDYFCTFHDGCTPEQCIFRNFTPNRVQTSSFTPKKLSVLCRIMQCRVILLFLTKKWSIF